MFLGFLGQVTQTATDIGIAYYSMRAGTPGFYTNTLPKQGLLEIGRQSHILTSVILKDAGHRAIFTDSRSPILFILRIDKRATFLKITSTIVISIKEFTFATVRSFQGYLNPCEVFTSTGINTDCIPLINKGGCLYFQTCVGNYLFCDASGCVSTC